MPFITDAPSMVLRQMQALGARFAYEDAISNVPAWADQVMYIAEASAWSLLTNLRDAGYRVEAWAKPKVMTPDPTFAMAAARDERERGGSAPAASWAR